MKCDESVLEFAKPGRTSSIAGIKSVVLTKNSRAAIPTPHSCLRGQTRTTKTKLAPRDQRQHQTSVNDMED